MHKVFLSIGGNIGNKQKNFEMVWEQVANELGEIVDFSSIYETPPWGFHAEEEFWNQILVIQTILEPIELLWRIHKIEESFGRKRGVEQYASREMDIDILYVDDIFMETKNLIIPHPKIQERKFILVPLCEVSPELKHPLLRLTSVQMLEACRDESIIKKVKTK